MVVDYHREHVSGRAVGAQHDQVVDFIGLDLHSPLNSVLNDPFAIIRCP